MAIGDAAAAKGMTVVPATQAINLGYQAINQAEDYIAAEIDARAGAVSAINAKLADSGWLSFTPNTGWVANNTATFGTLAYRRIGNVLYLRGSAQFNSGGSTVGSLPAGFRTTYSVQVPVPNFPGNGAYMTLRPDGAVLIEGMTLTAGNIFQLSSANGVLLN